MSGARSEEITLQLRFKVTITQIDRLGLASTQHLCWRTGPGLLVDGGSTVAVLFV